MQGDFSIGHEQDECTGLPKEKEGEVRYSSSRFPKKLCPVCEAALEKLSLQLSRLLHSCMGQAST